MNFALPFGECEWVRQEFAGRSRDLTKETKEKRR
jgi:hypothetical protein